MFDFGLVGLGVMGRNFILNVASKGYSSIGLSSRQDSIDILEKDGKDFVVSGTSSDEDFIKRLKKPRKIMLLVPAGNPVDSVIERFLPYLDEGDIIIDGGNSHYDDTERRYKYLKDKKINYVGAGVSGGSRGARLGPSIMPGCDKESYEVVKPIFEAASAKVNDEPCVSYLGNTSAGHYVKMIHNGIEYAIMQLISENYHVLKYGLGKSNDEISQIFKEWNEGILESYLIEISRDIFKAKDEVTDNYLIDMILDKAKQKGTGKWTSQSAMDFGACVPTIDSSVSMRIISSFKDLRIQGNSLYGIQKKVDKTIDLDDIRDSQLFTFIVSFAQGLSQLKIASEEKGYDLNFESICKIWRGGCIIRAKLLENFMVAFSNNKELENLLFDKEISELIKNSVESARKVSIYCIENHFPAHSLLASISYFDALKTAKLPTNLIQAQRDCFGEHTFERVDKPGTFHYKNWQE